jgi:hypothetical protein
MSRSGAAAGGTRPTPRALSKTGQLFLAGVIVPHYFLRSFAPEGEDCNGLLYHLSAQGDSSLGMTGIWSPDVV